jgi:hypothetical protein
MDDDVLFRLELRVCPALVGSKTAVQYGPAGPIYVSPAMFSLFTTATPEELETLMKTIMVQTLPVSARPLSKYQHVPMPAIKPEEWK